MELSVLIARIAAVVYLSAALGAIFSGDHYHRVLDDLFKNAALIYFMGFTAVIVGFLIVHYHNIWVRDWTVLITLLGWLALAKGVLLIAFPKFIQRLAEPIFAGESVRVFPFVAACLGFLFGYFGFAN